MSLVSTCLPSTVSKLEASLHIFKEYVYFSVSHRKKKCAPCGKRTLFTRRRHAGPPRRPPFSKLARFLGWCLYTMSSLLLSSQLPSLVSHSAPSLTPLTSLPP